MYGRNIYEIRILTTYLLISVVGYSCSVLMSVWNVRRLMKVNIATAQVKILVQMAVRKKEVYLALSSSPVASRQT
jgi:hypothetical protein